MPSTYSSRLRLELMGSGEQSGSWGTKTNTNLGTLIEEAIAGYESIATGDANVTLTTSNGATDQARKAMLKFTGTLTAIRNITVPSVSKIYVIHNGCTGFPILVKTSGGVGQYVDIGEKVALYCDGSEVYRVDDVRPGYNAIINGDMNIAQRGTSFPAVVSASYTLDRYNTGNTSAAVYTVSQNTDVPTVAQAGRLFTNSFNLQVTTADASLAAGDLVAIYQPVEGYNWLPLAQRVNVYSSWCKAKKTGTYGALQANSGADRSCVAEFTMNAADTWEYKTVAFPASPSAGTWNYTNGIGIYMGICLMAGSTFQTTANAWQTGNFRSTSNQVNAMDNTANYFRTTGWKLEPGSVATMSLPKTFDEELAACQRYYNTKTIVMSAPFLSYYGGSNAVAPFYDYPVPMRTVPSLTITNAGVEYYSYAGVWTASTLVNWSTSMFGVQVSCPSDGDGRGKLMRSGAGGANPNPILVLSAEL